MIVKGISGQIWCDLDKLGPQPAWQKLPVGTLCNWPSGKMNVQGQAVKVLSMLNSSLTSRGQGLHGHGGTSWLRCPKEVASCLKTGWENAPAGECCFPSEARMRL